jgi:ABC-type antimicrobial peptide transport system permease subunit
VGGLAGVGLGIAASFVVGGSMGWPAVISSVTILVGLGISTLVGLTFGYYPAWRASALDPIEALRFE